MSKTLPAQCFSCGNLFASSAFSNVTGQVTLEQNFVDCPECGEPAALAEGLFDFSENAVAVISAPEVTVEMIIKLGAAARKAYQDKATLDEFAETASGIHPSFGNIFDAIPDKSKSWPTAFLFLIILAKSCQPDINFETDVNINSDTDISINTNIDIDLNINVINLGITIDADSLISEIIDKSPTEIGDVEVKPPPKPSDANDNSGKSADITYFLRHSISPTEFLKNGVTSDDLLEYGVNLKGTKPIGDPFKALDMIIRDRRSKLG